MDTSETYIKMCEKAEEIQKLKDYQRAGDFFITSPIVLNEVLVNFEDGEYGWVADKEDVWLPRQDQLQEMVRKPLWELNGDFYDWLFDSTNDGWHVKHEHLSFTSMEQLWLAFVMREKYGKTWDGEEWVTL